MIAGGTLSLSLIRAVWEKLPSEKPQEPNLRPFVGEAGARDRVVPVEYYEAEFKGLSGDDDFKSELMRAVSEEIGKVIDRAFVEDLLR